MSEQKQLPPLPQRLDNTIFEFLQFLIAVFPNRPEVPFIKKLLGSLTPLELAKSLQEQGFDKLVQEKNLPCLFETFRITNPPKLGGYEEGILWDYLHAINKMTLSVISSSEKKGQEIPKLLPLAR